MPDSGLVAALKKSEMFSSLDSAMLQKIASLARWRSFAAREMIFSEGEPCGGFYLLVEGAVKVYKLSGDGKEHVLHLVWPGETFAEAALFLGDTYPAYAETVRASRAVLFPSQPFLALLRAEPDVAIRLMGGMALWLRRLVGQVEVLALRGAASRLAGYLLGLQEGPAAVLPAPKAVVAAHLGMTPETLSRLFFRMEAQGVIRVRGRTISILDAPELRRIADGESDV
ncbi:MAG: Crp/Fnr family transcriptional regulator [Armatimonadota bacterium]